MYKINKSSNTRHFHGKIMKMSIFHNYVSLIFPSKLIYQKINSILNSFQDNVMATMSDIRQDEDFFDVTLAIDGKQLRAHKLILSACSFFFRKLLRNNPAPNPVIVLWDVTFDDMLNLLDFMYNGEVRVKQANIQNFLAIAEKFRVRGLCQSESSGQPSRSNTPQPQKSPMSSAR